MDVHGRDLRYFVAVAEELHFTRAAERLFISQPALSKQIRTLERTLGVVLFERAAKDVRLTPAGATFLPKAREVLAAWDSARQTIEQSKRTQEASLTVGMSTSLGRDGLLPAIRSRFTDQLPDAQITLRQVGWADPSAGLANGSSDAAFVWLPLPDARRYQWAVIVQEPLLVALPEGHPLANQKSIGFDDLLAEPFLALPKSAGPLRDYWLAVDQRRGQTPLIGAEITSPDETYEFLVEGRGICLLASGNAPSLTRGGVITRRVRGLPPCQLAVAWRRDADNPLVRAYVAAAREVTRDLSVGAGL
jgi:DNA-binding transcriptional LysR family regulator